MFNFITEQKHIFYANEELEKTNQLFRLSYLYQFGPKHEFNKKCRKILSDDLKPHVQPWKNKTKLVLTTKHQYSLNALLARQKPSHDLLTTKKTIF